MCHSIESLIYDFIVENNIATEDEINLVTDINGWGKDQLNDIIYARTGYHDAEQCVQSEPDAYQISDDDLADYYGLNDEEEDEEEEE